MFDILRGPDQSVVRYGRATAARSAPLRLGADALMRPPMPTPFSMRGAHRLDVAHTMPMRFLVKTVHCTATRVVVGDQRDSILHLSVDAVARTLRIAKAYALRAAPPPRAGCGEALTIIAKALLLPTPGTRSCALLRRQCRGSAKAARWPATCWGTCTAWRRTP